MTDKKTKWLIYTVLVGLLPGLCRVLAWIVTNSGIVNILSPSDFVAFGLVLHISNINEVEHLGDEERDWKTVQNGISITFITFYSVLYTLTLVPDKVVDIMKMTYCSGVLAIVSFLISYSVYDRIASIEKVNKVQG
ncbi:MAG: hypothetical protein HKK67_08950 [Chlorobiaceae bacterium]|nr:hypothetical protein [Chlorobiaceae bacterium]